MSSCSAMGTMASQARRCIWSSLGKVREEHLLPAPEIVTIEDPENYRVLGLESLVEMKLMSSRLKDQVHVRDLIGVRLVDATWLPKLPPVLAERLKALLDSPEG